jgi:hypothetical protein
MLLMTVIQEVKGEDHIPPTMAKFHDTLAYRSMQRALDKIRNVVGESGYQFFSFDVGQTGRNVYTGHSLCKFSATS